MSRELYSVPKFLNYSRLQKLFSRYAGGEELSHLKREWPLLENRMHPMIRMLLATPVILAAAATVSFPFTQ